MTGWLRKASIGLFFTILGVVPVDAFGADPQATGGPESITVTVGDAFSPGTLNYYIDLYNYFLIDPVGSPGVLCAGSCTYRAVHISGPQVTAPDDDSVSGLPNGYFNVLDVDDTTPFSTGGDDVFHVFAERTIDGVESDALVVNVRVNGAPTDISMDSQDVDENQLVGAAVGNFSSTDPNSPDSFTYTLVAGSGDTDNASFSIIGSQLRTAAVFDYETKNSYSIRVRSTDGSGLTFEESFAISVNDLNDNAPVINSSNTATVNENQTGAIDVNATDADGTGANNT
ncbi:MAG: cadherin repeat domain-containing protein, partial [Pseudomonadales bacterium]|nr:cadherin repeat domain-containing protein [Pseudomonadales bacterium]